MKALFAAVVLAAFMVILAPASAGACTTEHGLGYRPESWYIGSGSALPVEFPQAARRPLGIKRWQPILRSGGGIAYGGIRFYAPWHR